jgi:hypothetical protein
MHIRYSGDRGQTWSGDATTLPLTKNPSLAVDTDGRVGLLYQQFKGNRWITNLEVTADGWATQAPVFTLHKASATEPARDWLPYLGDYTRLLALGRSFYGAFCGSNAPLTANFPAASRTSATPTGSTGHSLTSAGSPPSGCPSTRSSWPGPMTPRPARSACCNGGPAGRWPPAAASLSASVRGAGAGSRGARTAAR